VLAGAVSDAGGLGTFGAAHKVLRINADYVREQVRLIKERTRRPFGIGFLTHNLPQSEETFVATLQARPPVILFSFGDPAPWLPLAKYAGARTICQVQTMEDARRVIDAGADVLAVQGNEAGGHTGRANLLPFLVQALDAFPEVPVIAAGGITTGRALAAVLAAGGDGAWMGTLFTAVAEAVEMSAEHKQAVIESDGTDTVYSNVHDIMNAGVYGDLAWPPNVGARAKRNDFLDQWYGSEEQLRDHVDENAAAYRAAYRSGDSSVVPFYFGEGAAAITSVTSAAEAIGAVIAEAERHLLTGAKLVR
jgi:nitronate monooxygenase